MAIHNHRQLSITLDNSGQLSTTSIDLHGELRRWLAAAPADEVRDEGSPPGLVRGTKTNAGVPVEILAEDWVHRPQGPAQVIAGITWTASVGSRSEESDETALELICHLTQVEQRPRPTRELDAQPGTRARGIHP